MKAIESNQEDGSKPFLHKVKKILKSSLDLIPSPSPSVKIQIMSGKVCLRYKGKTLLGIVNKHLKTKSLLTTPSNVLPLSLKPIVWIFIEGEGDGIKSRLLFKIFFTLISTSKRIWSLYTGSISIVVYVVLKEDNIGWKTLWEKKIKIRRTTEDL